MIAVFTPACRPGGLDVNYASLKKQQHVDLDDVIWIIADELYEQRREVVMEEAQDLQVIHFDSSTLRVPGNRRTLAAAYVWAIEKARDLDADLFVSMQDYMWVPDEGLAMFEEVAGRAERPTLPTGLTSISADPPPSAVIDPEGLWTVFAEAYDGHQPQETHWADVRDQGQGIVAYVEATWWEANWSAVSKGALFDSRCYYDVAYDRGVAYENQDYAFRAEKLGYKTVLDCDNHAISLPHKQYFPTEELEDFKHMNTDFHHARWGLPL